MPGPGNPNNQNPNPSDNDGDKKNQLNLANGDLEGYEAGFYTDLDEEDLKNFKNKVVIGTDDNVLPNGGANGIDAGVSSGNSDIEVLLNSIVAEQGEDLDEDEEIVDGIGHALGFDAFIGAPGEPVEVVTPGTYFVGDVVALGAGNDQMWAGGGNDIVFGEEGNDVIRGEDGDDALFGQDGNDVLMGGDGRDYLGGGAGNDELHDGDGEDLLEGGDGDDTIFLDNDGDVDEVDGGDGDDDTVVFQGFGGDDGVKLGALIDNIVNVENFELGAGSTNLFGTGADETLIGNDDANIIEGGGGDDTIFGMGGDDTLVGDNGDDGADTIHGGDGNDLIYGDNWDGDITTRVSPGPVPNNDTIFGENGDDIIVAGAGDDYVEGGEGDDEIHGNSGADELHGNAGDDEIFGLLGDDTIDGGAGNDTIEGGDGDDTMTGGDDADDFVFDADGPGGNTLGDGDTDTITDLDFTDGDALVFRDMPDSGDFTIASMNDLLNASTTHDDIESVVQNGANVEITVDVGSSQTIVLENFALDFPAHYTSEIQSGVTITDSVPTTGTLDDPDPAVSDYFHFFAEAGDTVSLEGTRLDDGFDMAFWLVEGIVDDPSTYFDANTADQIDLGDPGVFNFSDDEIDHPGPFGDPEETFVVSETGYYTVIVTNFASDATQDGGDGDFDYQLDLLIA